MDERLRQPDALLETFGQLANRLRQLIAERDLLDHPVDPLLRGRPRERAHRRRPLEVLLNEHLAIERVALGQIADRLSHTERVDPEVAAVHLRGAGGGGDEAGQDLHRRRLAGPVRAEEAEDFALAQLEARVLEGDEAPVLLAEAFGLDHDVAHVGGLSKLGVSDPRKKGASGRRP